MKGIYHQGRSWKGSKHMGKNSPTNPEIYIFDRFPSEFKSIQGTLSYTEIQKNMAKDILEGPIKSYIKDKDILDKLSTDIGIDIPYNNSSVELEHGNECLVIKVKESKLQFFKCIIRYDDTESNT